MDRAERKRMLATFNAIAGCIPVVGRTNGYSTQLDGAEYSASNIRNRKHRLINKPGDRRRRINMILTLPRLSLSHWNWSLLVTVIFVMSLGVNAWSDEPRFIDHSLLIAPEYPCTWPSHPFPRFAIVHQRKIGPESAYNIDSFLIDGNTGTQLDVPPHSVARPE
jgi:hypothetical protein